MLSISDAGRVTVFRIDEARMRGRLPARAGVLGAFAASRSPGRVRLPFTKYTHLSGVIGKPRLLQMHT
jgi:hypothetical protein